MDASLEDRGGLRREDQTLAGTGASACGDIIFGELWGLWISGAGRSDKVGDIFDDMVGDRDLADDILQVEEFLAGKDGLGFVADAGGGGFENGLLLLGQRVVDPDIEHEAVELGFRERVGAFLLDGVLCREHEERLGEFVGGVAGGDHFLLHGFEERGLGFRRGAVDFVSEEEVAKNRAFDEPEFLFAGGLVGLEHIGADDVAGHEVGRELHALELEIQHLGDGFNGEGLCHAGQADQKGVAVGKDAHEDLVENFALTDDDLADLGADAVGVVAHFFDESEFVGCGVVFGLGRFRGRCWRSGRGRSLGGKAYRARGERLRRGMELKKNLPHPDNIAIGKSYCGDFGFINGAAVGAVEVGENPLTVLAAQLGVARGNGCVLDWQIHLVQAAQHDDIFGEFVALAGVWAGVEGDAVIHGESLLNNEIADVLELFRHADFGKS